MTTETNVPDRHPLARISRTVGTVRAVVAAVLSVPAVVAIVGADLPGAVDTVLGALVLLVAALGPLWSAGAVRKQAEPLVTPVADPRDNTNQPLRPVRLDSDGVYRVTGLDG